MVDLVAPLLAVLALATIATAAAMARRELRALVRVEAEPLQEPLLVVIPARNEAANLRAHLPALLAEPAPDLRVVVVDDASADDTGAVVAELAARDPRLRLLCLTDEPPAGVFGKPRALAAAMDHAAMDHAAMDHAARDHDARSPLPALALFLDADMEPQPGLCGGLVATLRRERAHALSGVPRLVLGSAVEVLFLPTLVALLTGGVRAARVHDAKARDAFLNGQVLLVDTGALAQVGGWRAVGSTVLEDVALARRLKDAGRALRLGDLRGLVATRMYASYAEMARGFGKNATALLGRKAGLLGLASLALSLVPWAALGLAAARAAPLPLLVVAVAFCATLLVQASTRRDAGAPWWPVLVLPLSYLGAALILLRASLADVRRAPVEWRGRRYPR